MAKEIKLSKFDNELWGFRLTGGKDFGTILTIIKVSQGSLAEKAGLRVGDLLLAINDQPLTAMTHSEAHEAIIHAGNNFVFTLVRGSLVKPPPMVKFNDFSTCNKTDEETAIDTNDESKSEEELLHISNKKEESFYALGSPLPEISVTPPPRSDLEELEERDHESKKECSPEQELQEMMLGHGQVIIGNAIGVDFYKMTPKCQVIEKSEVLQAIKEEKKTDAKKTVSKFLQQPDRPVVWPKQEPTQIINSYKPTIKIPRKGHPTVENTERHEYTETHELQNKTEDQTAIKDKTEEENNITQSDSANDQRDHEEKTNQGENETQIEQNSEEQINNQIVEISIEEDTVQDKNDIDARLLKINEQLANLMSMPQEMQHYLLQVKQQIAQIMQIKHGNQDDVPNEESKAEPEEEDTSTEPQDIDSENQLSKKESNNIKEERTLNDGKSASDNLEFPAEDQIPPTGDDSEGAEVKEETSVNDAKPKDTEQQITEKQQEDKPRRDIKWQKEPEVKIRPFFPLTPKPRSIVVPGDVYSITNEGMFSEDFIAETLTGNAEIILGRTIGNNFLKFKNYDHLQLSNVYKMVHQDEVGAFPSRSGKLPSKDDYLQSAEKTHI